MSDRESTMKVVVTTYFPMFIAALSLITAIYNGYLNNKFVDLIQNNIARVEYLRTCKETIDAYFQVKFRTSLVSRNGARSGGGASAELSGPQIEAENAVSKFAALGTYLANLRNEQVRQHYTDLSVKLQSIIRDAARTAPAELGKLFEPADRIFADMNSDCVKSATAASLK
jgi:hypothetical protein